jgi:hypothetical protein
MQRADSIHPREYWIGMTRWGVPPHVFWRVFKGKELRALGWEIFERKGVREAGESSELKVAGSQ